MAEGNGVDRRGLCGTSKGNLPAGKHKHGWMALEGTGKYLCTLNTQIDSSVLDGRDGGLRSPKGSE